MTIKDFKERYNILTRNDVKAPLNDELKLWYESAVNDIYDDTLPLEKVEKDFADFGVARWLDKEHFLKKFDMPDLNDETADTGFLNENLITAIIYNIAARRSIDERNAELFRRKYRAALSQYELAHFNEYCHNLKSALEVNGWDKPYVVVSSLNNKIIFEPRFLEMLDYYLADKRHAANINYRHWIWGFIDYQDGKISGRRDFEALDTLMSEMIKK